MKVLKHGVNVTKLFLKKVYRINTANEVPFGFLPKEQLMLIFIENVARNASC